MDKIWIKCEICGYSKQVWDNELLDLEDCSICGNRMVLDINQGKTQQLGDNYPHINIENNNHNIVSKKFKMINNKLYANNTELEEIFIYKDQNLPKITEEDVNNFILDLNTKKVEELFKV